MKKLLYLFLCWVPSQLAMQHDITKKEKIQIIAGFCCGSTSVAGCGACTGAMLLKEGVIAASNLMAVGSGIACIGLLGAGACYICNEQDADKKIQKQIPQIQSMMYNKTPEIE